MVLNTLNPIPLPDSDALSQPRKPFKGDSLRELVRYVQSPDFWGYISQRWSEYLNNQSAQLQSAPTRVNSEEFDDQTASLGATDFTGGGLPAGYYRPSWYVSITRAAGVSSSVIVTFDWTDGGLTKSKSYPAVIGNLLTTADHGGGIIRLDQDAPLRVSTTYASVGAPTAVYDLVVTLERVEA